MADLNMFNDADGEFIGDAVTAIGCTLVGICAMVVAAFVGMREVAAVHLSLVFGGITIAAASRRWRTVATGLAVGGLVPVVIAFVVMWLMWSMNAVMVG